MDTIEVSVDVDEENRNSNRCPPRCERLCVRLCSNKKVLLSAFVIPLIVVAVALLASYFHIRDNRDKEPEVQALPEEMATHEHSSSEAVTILTMQENYTSTNTLALYDDDRSLVTYKMTGVPICFVKSVVVKTPDNTYYTNGIVFPKDLLTNTGRTICKGSSLRWIEESRYDRYRQ